MSDAVNMTGNFLVALPGMGDPRFEQAVIFVCSHDESGAMGLTINKVHGELSGGPLTLSHILLQAGIEGDVCVADSPVLAGGPVDIDRGFVIHTSDYFNEDASLKLSNDLMLTSTRDILEALVSSEVAPQKAVLAVGYSGWGPGQLEKELENNSWLSVTASSDIIFDSDNDNKWARAIAKLGISPEMLAHRGGSA